MSSGPIVVHLWSRAVEPDGTDGVLVKEIAVDDVLLDQAPRDLLVQMLGEQLLIFLAAVRAHE